MGPELHLNVSGQQEPLLLLDLYSLQGLNCTWRHLTAVFRLQKLVLHLDISIDNSSLCYICMSLDSRSLCYIWTYLDYRGPSYIWTSRLQEPVLYLDISKLQEPLLHLDVSWVSWLQGRVLHLDYKSLCNIWTYLDYRSQCYIWTYRKLQERLFKQTVLEK